jgi:hypothetical protein
MFYFLFRMEKLSDCVICNAPFKRSQSKEQHLSDCAKIFHIRSDSLQQLIEFRIRRLDPSYEG